MSELLVEALRLAADDKLITLWLQQQEVLAETQAILYQVEDEMVRRMLERQAVAIPSELANVFLEVRDTYDRTAFAPLKELLAPEDLERCWSPPYSEVVTHAEAWDTVKAKDVARRYGREALEVVERARVPGRPKAKVVKKG